jgi:AcrR family transcriptional regulator
MQNTISTLVNLRRRPTQRRSRFTYEAILEAFTLILDRQTFDSCTSNQIAEVAGFGIGTFYEYFSNKETVLAVWLREQYKCLIDKLDSVAVQSSSLSFEAVLRQMIDVCFDHHSAHPGTWRQTITLGRLITKPAQVTRHNQAAIACWDRFLSMHFKAQKESTDTWVLARGVHICLHAHIEHALVIDHRLLNSQEYREEIILWLLGRLQKT